MPPVEMSPEILSEELSDHVHFLAQPRLKGRKPLSTGSALARTYIRQQFEALGLVPWGQANGFAQPFVLGTNVVAVLPGSDPNLAQEVVILSAHYDHLGHTKQGGCLGAADNAAGVAALLEIAESLAMSATKPKRSICFAAFDQEENGLLGAFSFACREDFDPNRVVGVINIDLLGRQGYEVLDNHLFLSGTGDHRDLRRQIQCAANGRIEILPAGTDIVGPRGDHAAFEGLGFPAMFYSCGLYKDYHRAGDTPDKLDYDKMGRSTAVIEETVSILADAKERFVAAQAPQGDLEELQVLDLCLDRLAERLDIWELTEADANSIQALSISIKRLLEAGAYTRSDRERLIRRAALALFPVFSRFEPDDASPSDRKNKTENEAKMAVIQKKLVLLEMMELRPLIAQAGRALVKHLPKNRARLLWSLPKLDQKDALIPDLYMSYGPWDDETYQLLFVVFKGGFTFKWPGILWMPLTQLYDAELGAELVAFHGTPQEISDACLLFWKERAKKQAFFDRLMPKVLACVTQETDNKTYEQWMSDRLAQAAWADETAWFEQMMLSPNPRVALTAIRLGKKVLADEWERALQPVFLNADTHVNVKWTAMDKLDGRHSKETLLSLVGLLKDDRKRSSTSRILRFREADHPTLTLIRFSEEYTKLKPKPKPKKSKLKRKPKPSPQTLGEQALAKLKTLTKKDFGKDTQAWMDWINTHWQT